MSLTPEQIAATDKMSLDDIRALALKESEVQAEPVTEKKEQPRDETGKFAKAQEQEEAAPKVETNAEPNEEPTVTIYRKEIDNGNGVIEVFEAESLEDLVEKIAEGKRNASIKIRELNAERKQTQIKTEQQIKDENYVIEQKFKTNPAETVRELAKQAAAEQIASNNRTNEAASRFINTHPDYVADPANGNGDRLFAEYQRLHPQATELTSEGLEKAYQSLKNSGLLKLKDVEASGATEDEAKEPQRIADPKVEATQQRSQKTSSTISTRTSSRTAAPRNAQPTLDELYDDKKFTLEQIKELANKQLASGQ